jgi:hypothetical protein
MASGAGLHQRQEGAATWLRRAPDVVTDPRIVREVADRLCKNAISLRGRSFASAAIMPARTRPRGRTTGLSSRDPDRLFDDVSMT